MHLRRPDRALSASLAMLVLLAGCRRKSESVTPEQPATSGSAIKKASVADSEIAGTLGGVPWTGVDAVQARTGRDDTPVGFIVASAPDLCARGAGMALEVTKNTHQLKVSLGVLDLQTGEGAPPSAPGEYRILPAGRAKTGGNVARAAHVWSDGECHDRGDTDDDQAVSGAVTLTSVEGSIWIGTVDLTMKKRRPPEGAISRTAVQARDPEGLGDGLLLLSTFSSACASSLFGDL